MSTPPKQPNRIPFEDLGDVVPWSVPFVGKGKVLPTAEREEAKQDKAAATEATMEDFDGEIVMRPMTAEQLQEITEQAEREGFEKGYQDGLNKGISDGQKQGALQGEKKAYQEVRADLEEQKKRFADMATALCDPIAMQDAELENIIVDMAVHIAKHLVGRELTLDPTILFPVVEQAMEKLPAGASNIRIFLHPDDVEMAQTAFTAQGHSWTVFPDTHLARGGCRVESRESLVNFAVEKRLHDMLQTIRSQGDVDEPALDAVPDYRPPKSASTIEDPSSPVQAHEAEETLSEEAAEAVEGDSESKTLSSQGSIQQDLPENEALPESAARQPSTTDSVTPEALAKRGSEKNGEAVEGKSTSPSEEGFAQGDEQHDKPVDLEHNTADGDNNGLG